MRSRVGWTFAHNNEQTNEQPSLRVSVGSIALDIVVDFDEILGMVCLGMRIAE